MHTFFLQYTAKYFNIAMLLGDDDDDSWGLDRDDDKALDKETQHRFNDVVWDSVFLLSATETFSSLILSIFISIHCELFPIRQALS